MNTKLTTLATATVFILAACSAGEPKPAETQAPPASAATTGENLTPDAGGKIIEVQMLTDEQGNNKFEPAHIEARPGDVIRYSLKTGVHNVNFPADSNSGKSGLPAAGQLLQLPGQAYDVKVTWAPGSYYFHCDPHALLGMKGHLEVAAR
jgi:plastocyanin